MTASCVGLVLVVGTAGPVTAEALSGVACITGAGATAPGKLTPAAVTFDKSTPGYIFCISAAFKLLLAINVLRVATSLAAQALVILSCKGDVTVTLAGVGVATLTPASLRVLRSSADIVGNNFCNAV